MQIIEGNILDFNKGVICHVVNCQGKMASGIAKTIRDKYPKHYEDYITVFNEKKNKLGSTVLTEINAGLYICGIHAQLNYGYNGQRYLNYEALYQGLEWIGGNFANYAIYFPFLMGSHRAGGNWNIVCAMIQECCPNGVIVKLPNLLSI